MKKIAALIADTNEFLPSKDRIISLGGEEGNFHGRKYASLKTGEYELFVVLTGIGKVNAATAAAHIISEYKPDVIFNVGYSGACSGLRRGDYVLGTSFTECDFDLTPLGLPIGIKPEQESVYAADDALNAKLLTIPYLKSGKLGTGDFFLTDAVKKDLYIKTFGISAFDMETGAIASVCNFSGVPFASVRKISDDASDVTVDDYKAVNDSLELALADLLFDMVKAFV